MGKFLFNFRFWKKPISCVLLAVFMVGIFNTITLPPKVKAQSFNDFKVNVIVDKKGTLWGPQNEFIIYWTAPNGVEEAIKKIDPNGTKCGNPYWVINVQDDTNKTLYTSRKLEFSTRKDNFNNLALKENGTYKVFVDLRLDNCGSEIRGDDNKNQPTIGQKIIKDIKLSVKIIEGTTDSSNCSLINVKGYWEIFRSGEKPMLHLSWDYNTKCTEYIRNIKINPIDKNIYDPPNTLKTQNIISADAGLYTLIVQNKQYEEIGKSTINMPSPEDSTYSFGDQLSDEEKQSQIYGNTQGEPPSACENISLFSGDLWGSVRGVICRIMESIVNMFSSLAEWALKLLIDVAAITESSSDSKPLLIEGIKQDNIKEVWNYSLTIVDALIVIILLIAAFANILRIQLDTYAVKKLLPSLITGIIAAHFSYFLIYFLLDINAIITTQAIQWGSHGEGVQGLANRIQLATLPTTLFVAAMPLVNIIYIFALIVPTVLIFMLAFLLYARIFIIFLLTMFSPLALVAMGIPQFSQYFKSWWKQLINWVFMPTVIFIILGAGASFVDMDKLKNLSESPFEGFKFSNIGNWVIGVLILYTAYKIPMKSMGGSVGNIIVSGGKSFQGFAGKVSGRVGTKALGNLTRMSEAKEGDEGLTKAFKWFGRQGVGYANLSSPAIWKRTFEEGEKVSSSNREEYEKDVLVGNKVLGKAMGRDARLNLMRERKGEIASKQSLEQLGEKLDDEKMQEAVKKLNAKAAEEGVKNENLEESGLSDIANLSGDAKADAIIARRRLIEDKYNAQRHNSLLNKQRSGETLTSKETGDLNILDTQRKQLQVLNGLDSWLNTNWFGAKFLWRKTAGELGLDNIAGELVETQLNLAKAQRSSFRTGRQSMSEMSRNPINYVPPARGGRGGRTAFFGGDGDIDSISYKGQPITTAMTIDHIDIDPAEKDKIRKSLSLGTRLDESWSRRTASEIARKTGETQEQAMTRLASTQRRELAKNDSLYLKRAKERLSSSGLDDSEYDSIKTALSRGDFNPQEALKTLQTNVSTLRTQGADAEVVQKTIDTLQSSGAVSPISMSEFKTNDAQAAEALSRFAEKRAKALEAVLTAHAQVHPNQAINAESLGQISNEAIQDALAQQEKINIQIEDAISKASEMKQGGGNSEDLQAQLAQIAFSQNVEVSPAQMQTITQNITKHLDTGDRAVITQQISEEFNKIKQSASVQGSYNPNDQTTPNNEGTPFDPSK